MRKMGYTNNSVMLAAEVCFFNHDSIRAAYSVNDLEHNRSAIVRTRSVLRDKYGFDAPPRLVIAEAMRQ